MEMTFRGSQDVCRQVQIFPAHSRFIINAGAVCVDLFQILVVSYSGIYVHLSGGAESDTEDDTQRS